MSKWIKCLLASLMVFSSVSTFAATQQVASPVGYWQTIDDVTNKPKSILQITMQKNNTIMGRVIKIFPRPGYDQNEVCSACQGRLKNKPIVGMVVMYGLKRSESNPNQWTGGSIMDPLNGKTYHCNLELISGGRQATVRGFIGLPLFGRSQTWNRVSSAK